MKVVATRGYEKRVRHLTSDDKRLVAEAEIVARPEVWPVLQARAAPARLALPCEDTANGAAVA